MERSESMLDRVSGGSVVSVSVLMLPPTGPTSHSASDRPDMVERGVAAMD